MSALADRAVTDVRKIHLEMIDAVLAGGGVEPVAAIAAEHLGGPVRIVLGDLSAGTRGRRRVAEVPVRSGDEVLGHVALYDTEPDDEVLELAAIAALTAVTLRDANVTQRRATAELLDDLRAGLPAEEVVSRARRLGADLSRGASALSVRGHSERILATIAQEFPGALAAPRGDRVEALLPSAEPDGAARRLARRLGTTGLSPFEPDPGALGDALHVAELSAALEGVELDELLRGSLAAAARQRRRGAPGADRLDRRAGGRSGRDRARVPGARREHERHRGGDLRASPHGRQPARPRAGPDRPRSADAGRAGAAGARAAGARHPARGRRIVRAVTFWRTRMR